MPFNGMGTFTPVYNWQTDKANGIKIRADRMDGQDGDIADGLTDCVTRDGQSAATANLPMGTFKHTGVGLASSRTDYLRASQAQDNDLTYFLTTGTIDSYVLTPSPAVTALTPGLSFFIRVHVGSQSPTPVINVSGLGATTIAHSDLTPLSFGEMATDGVQQIVYGGTVGFLLPNTGLPRAIRAVRERTTISATAASGTIQFDGITQASLYYTTAASGNWTMNIRGNSSITLNAFMATGDDLTIVFKATQTGTAYFESGFTIDGNVVTQKWLNDSAPIGGTTNAIDVYTKTITKTADATFTVLSTYATFG